MHRSVKRLTGTEGTILHIVELKNGTILMTNQIVTPKEPKAIQKTVSDHYIQSFYALIEQETFDSKMWEGIPSAQQEALRSSFPQCLQEKAEAGITTEKMDNLIKNVRICGAQITAAVECRLYATARQAKRYQNRTRR